MSDFKAKIHEIRFRLEQRMNVWEEKKRTDYHI